MRRHCGYFVVEIGPDSQFYDRYDLAIFVIKVSETKLTLTSLWSSVGFIRILMNEFGGFYGCCWPNVQAEEEVDG